MLESLESEIIYNTSLSEINSTVFYEVICYANTY